ncbi:21836_t:CDS:2, partial [Entrophospora sp. SA101]
TYLTVFIQENLTQALQEISEAECKGPGNKISKAEYKVPGDKIPEADFFLEFSQIKFSSPYHFCVA